MWGGGNRVCIEGNFFDDNTLEDIVKKCDILIHAICTINPGTSNKRHLFAYENDFMQSIKLCHLCTRYNRRLVFISSGGAVYGNPIRIPIVEESYAQPINHYGNLKLCIENTYRTYAIQQGTDVIIIRFANIYGPGQDYTKGVGFIDAVIKRGIKKETIEIYGDGSIVRDYVYIDDACEMLTALLEYKGEYNTFNISTGLGVSQNDVVDIVRGYIPHLKINYIDRRSVDVKNIILDNSRIKSIYQGPIRSISEGIKDYIKHLAII